MLTSLVLDPILLIYPVDRRDLLSCLRVNRILRFISLLPLYFHGMVLKQRDLMFIERKESRESYIY